jgi:hypothetical protein
MLNKKLIILIALFNTFVLNEAAFKPLVASEDYTHQLIVDDEAPEQYQLFWKMVNDDEIQFEIHCKTTGWVGMGISPNGGMGGTD